MKSPLSSIRSTASNTTPQSLPPEHRDVPGGPASVLIDHPQVVDVIREVIGPDIRLEGCSCVWRKKGEEHGTLHGGGPGQADPIFGYRVKKRAHPRWYGAGYFLN